MSIMVVPVTTNPVVFFNDEAVNPGWYFRPAGREGIGCPFAARQEAVQFALKRVAADAAAELLWGAFPARSRAA